ncbi:MAG: DUF2306 domain-containing protein [Alphaproteobacteria bacterium]|nr:DUF2306 domain-containing protein [Alphaproteobacteria bacterium]
MTLEPLAAAPFVVQNHVAAALGAFLVGAIQLAGGKGTTRHRILGWSWVAMITVVALSSFWIQSIKNVGPWSAIHLLSIATLALVPLAVLAARRGNVRRHQCAMISLFAGALVIAGLFTLLPGRIMSKVVFGA